MSKMTAGQRDMALGQGAIALHFNRGSKLASSCPLPRYPTCATSAIPRRPPQRCASCGVLANSR